MALCRSVHIYLEYLLYVTCWISRRRNACPQRYQCLDQSVCPLEYVFSVFSKLMRQIGQVSVTSGEQTSQRHMCPHGKHTTWASWFTQTQHNPFWLSGFCSAWGWLSKPKRASPDGKSGLSRKHIRSSPSNTSNVASRYRNTCSFSH